MYDFHTHTFLSDGMLAPTELIRQAYVAGYQVIAVTDHVGPGNLEFVLKTLIADCTMASKRWDILALPGVEITYAPKDDIDLMAREARRLGANVVNVHGETIVEPVEPGTNLAAVSSEHVDILAHPGLITSHEAEIATRNGVFLELSSRRGHSITNGHVVKTANHAGSRMILNSDAHDPEDLLSQEFALSVALGAGLNQNEAEYLLAEAPLLLLQKVGAN
ncbi:histidinol phosphate phosphatase domain-containing protein [Dehalococcoidia bacterium]|nr:histidinol phosphate phosphatase domain-containing protein [Dehalococcoidia bacterium]